MKKVFKHWKFAAFSLLIIGAALFIWGFLIEPNQLYVNTYNVKVKNWDPRLNDFKIVAIADIHGGSNFINEEKIQEIVRQANAQDPDIIVLLGDYVSQPPFRKKVLRMPIETIAENLKGLKARYGVYAVLGNHDGWYGVEKIRKALEDFGGLRVLEFEAVSIEKNGAKLRIVGLPDSLSTNLPKNKIPNAYQGLNRLENKEGKVIAITHNPDDLYSLSEGGSFVPDFVLMIAGHTHGGQVSVPFFGAPVVPTEFGRRYARGFFFLNGVNLFVTSGIGTSILPVRFNVPPEIAVLNISAE